MSRAGTPSRKRPGTARTPHAAGRYGTFSWLLERLSDNEGEAVARVLDEYLPADRPVEIQTTGRPVERTHAHDAGIEYESFDPPESWDIPYSVLKVRFEPRQQLAFMSHEGEEVLIGTQGKIAYSFLVCHRGTRGLVREDLDPVGPGQWLRLRPSVPHNTTAISEPATAWMVLRSASGAINRLVTPQRLKARAGGREGKDTARRDLTEEQLTDPAKYVLISSGLADQIRVNRIRAGFSYADIERLSGVSETMACRIEQAADKVPLAATFRVARLLRVDVRQLLRPAGHVAHGRLFDKSSGGDWVPLNDGCVGGIRQVRVASCRLSPGTHTAINPPEAVRYASWIVLKGSVRIEGWSDAAGGRSVLSGGEVAHFREGGFPRSLKPLEPTEIILVAFP